MDAKKRMTTRAEMVRSIKIAARVSELRNIANDAAAYYDRALAASGLPKEHFDLRLVLRGILPSPSKDE
jgi:hypothetical protein